MSGTSLAGITFCITGKLSVKRSVFVAKVEAAGATVASTVSKAVTHLVCSDPTTSKAATAKGKGIKIVNEDWVDAKLAGGDGSEIDSADDHSASDDDAMDAAADGTPLQGMTFCITGTLSEKRADFVKKLKDAGGAVATTVTNAVTHLVCSDPSTSKAATAKGKGIKIVDEAWVKNLLSGGTSKGIKKDPKAAKYFKGVDLAGFWDLDSDYTRNFSDQTEISDEVR